MASRPSAANSFLEKSVGIRLRFEVLINVYCAQEKRPSRAFLYSNQTHLVSQDSTVAEPCSAFHSSRILSLPPLVSTTSPVIFVDLDLARFAARLWTQQLEHDGANLWIKQADQVLYMEPPYNAAEIGLGNMPFSRFETNRESPCTPHAPC